MAYIAKTAFEPRFTNGVFDETINIAGVYQDDGVAEVCSAGFICVEDEARYPNQGYPTGTDNGNTWIMAKCAALGNAPVYACNTYDINEIADPVTGNVYRVGSNTLGLPAPAGRPVAFTRIDFDKNAIYRFGEGNFSTAPDATKKYVTVADGLLVASDTAPAAGKHFIVLGSGKFTHGAYAADGYFDLKAVIA